jgi:hypothetical protein
VLGLPDIQLPDGSWLSQYGCGGDAANTPQYDARLMVLGEILGHDVTRYAISAGIIDPVSEGGILKCINADLESRSAKWRVQVTTGCFEFFDI